MNEQPSALEQVFTDYVVENANLKVYIKKLEVEVDRLKTLLEREHEEEE